MTQLTDEWLEVIFNDWNTVPTIAQLGEGNLAFTLNERTYLLSTFKVAILRFKEQTQLALSDDWFDQVELLTQQQFNNIIEKLL